ncbi:hypothetical protein L228DRAFT_242515 [Xylona heveae TC161]|uniref:Myb-like domain-containing protein n=1 Tax=Xylona heveae (strain CBS 132557 / TC161) TaxID=1328760 RepID=A0A165JDV7_XYLHT|nr:hypothetical protein L228DRAFT_242515 [Xylona heveae TC161]KZF26109.1 hypothetical protein L228DRAFT_242515 [Xylona heveae TC161]
MDRPAKRVRLEEPADDGEISDVEQARVRNDQRLKSAFEAIFEKYSRDFSGVGDEIDLETGEITVNNGHLRDMESEQDMGHENTQELLGQFAVEDTEPPVEEDDDWDELGDSMEVIQPRTPLETPQRTVNKEPRIETVEDTSYHERPRSTPVANAVGRAIETLSEKRGEGHTATENVPAPPTTPGPPAGFPGPAFWKEFGENLASKIVHSLIHLTTPNNDAHIEPAWRTPELPFTDQTRRPHIRSGGGNSHPTSAPRATSRSVWAHLTPTRTHRSHGAAPPRASKSHTRSTLPAIAPSHFTTATPNSLPSQLPNQSTRRNATPFPRASQTPIGRQDHATISNPSRFTADEDQMILELRINRRMTWKHLSEHFPTWSTESIRKRGLTLLADIEQPPNHSNETDHSVRSAEDTTHHPRISKRTPQNSTTATATTSSGNQGRNDSGRNVKRSDPEVSKASVDSTRVTGRKDTNDATDSNAPQDRNVQQKPRVRPAQPAVTIANETIPSNKKPRARPPKQSKVQDEVHPFASPPSAPARNHAHSAPQIHSHDKPGAKSTSSDGVGLPSVHKKGPKSSSQQEKRHSQRSNQISFVVDKDTEAPLPPPSNPSADPFRSTQRKKEVAHAALAKIPGTCQSREDVPATGLRNAPPSAERRLRISARLSQRDTVRSKQHMSTKPNAEGVNENLPSVQHSATPTSGSVPIVNVEKKKRGSPKSTHEIDQILTKDVAIKTPEIGTPKNRPQKEANHPFGIGNGIEHEKHHTSSKDLPTKSNITTTAKSTAHTQSPHRHADAIDSTPVSSLLKSRSGRKTGSSTLSKKQTMSGHGSLGSPRTQTPLASTPNSASRKCGTVGYKCQRVFCLNCQ